MMTKEMGNEGFEASVRPVDVRDLTFLRTLFGGSEDGIVGENGEVWHQIVDSCCGASGAVYFVAEEGKRMVGVMGLIYAPESAREQAIGRVTELVIYCSPELKQTEYESALFSYGTKQAQSRGYTNVFYRGTVFSI